MKGANFFASVLVGVLSVHAVASANTFTYTLEAYPKAAGNCHEAAVAAGEKWAQGSGTTVVSSRCEAITEEGYTIAIRYEAEKAIRPVSTTAPGGSMLDERGGYKKMEECEAALPGETTHFRDVTGITPVFSYCYKERYTRSYPFALRIEGFGIPRSWPQFAGALVFGKALGYSEKTFLDGIYRNLTAQGVDARFVTFQSSIGYGRITVFYYDPKPQDLHQREVAKVSTKEQCSAAVTEMNSFLATHGASPAFSYCSYVSVGGMFEVNLLNWGREPHEYNQTVETFATYQACEAGRPALTEYYKTTLKRPVVGSLCSWAKGHRAKWALVLFEERS